MNRQPILTDALVEQMLARRAGAVAPVGLTEAIGTAVAETSQLRRHWWERVPGPAPRAPELRLALVLALIGLLLATAMGAALIGSEFLRRSNELSVPVTSGAPTPAATFTVTGSAFGPITWSTIDTRGDRFWWPLVGTPHGPLVAVERAAGEGRVVELRWPGPDGRWLGLTLADDVAGMRPIGADVIVGTVGDSLPPAIWIRWSGSGWAIGEPVALDGAMDVNDAAVGPLGVLVTDGIAVQVSTDGRAFVRAGQPPAKAKLQPTVTECVFLGTSSRGVGKGHIGPMMVTDRGFVALTAADPADWSIDPTCEPLVWFSTDGSAWDLVSTSSPFGSGAYVREVASRAGRHVAIGGIPSSLAEPGAVWVSDDGLAWERLAMPEPAGTCPLEEPLACGHTYSRVVAGEAGWIILDFEGFAWTSADGRLWQAAAGWPGIPAGYVAQGLALSRGSIVETSFGGRGVFGTFAP
jgi:hypothetical protein